MAKQPRVLPVQSISYTANELKTADLPRTVYRSLGLFCEITHTNGGSPSITNETLLSILKRVRVVVNGQDVLVDLSARDLWIMNRYDYSRSIDPSLYTTASSQGTSSFYIRIPFEFVRSLQPEDGILDVRKASSVNLQVDWGSSVGSGVTSVDSGTLYIETDEYANVAAELPVGRHEMGTVEKNLDATGTIETNLEVSSNNQYRRLILMTLNSSDALADSQIDQIEVKSRSFDYVLVQKLDQLEKFNEQQYAVARHAGVYVLDFTRNGRLTQRIDARPLSELVVKVNSLVSNGKLRIVKDKAIFA